MKAVLLWLGLCTRFVSVRTTTQALDQMCPQHQNTDPNDVNERIRKLSGQKRVVNTLSLLLRFLSRFYKYPSKETMQTGSCALKEVRFIFKSLYSGKRRSWHVLK